MGLATGALGAVLLSATLPVVAPGLSSNDVAAPVLEVATEHLSRQLSERGLPTQAGAKVVAVLGQDRTRELTGCLKPQCLAELRNAFEADAVLSGTVSRSGDTLALRLMLTRLRDGVTLASYQGEAPSMSELPAALTVAADKLAVAAWSKLEAPAEEAHVGRSIATTATLIVALGSLITAAVMWGLSASANGRLGDGDKTLGTAEAFRLASTARTQQTVAIITSVVGGLAAVSCLGLVLSAAADPSPRIVLVPTGTGFALSGSF